MPLIWLREINIYRNGDDRRNSRVLVSIGGPFDLRFDRGPDMAASRVPVALFANHLNTTGASLVPGGLQNSRPRPPAAAFLTEIKVRRSKACRIWQGSIHARPTLSSTRDATKFRVPRFVPRPIARTKRIAHAHIVHRDAAKLRRCMYRRPTTSGY